MTPRSNTMTTLFPTNMPQTAMISTNRAGQKPAQPTKQQAKRPHKSTNESTGTPNINAWTKMNSRHRIWAPWPKITGMGLFKRQPLTGPKLIKNEQLHMRNTTNTKIQTTSRSVKTTRTGDPLNQETMNPFRIPNIRWPRQKFSVTNSMNQATPFGKSTSRPN